MGGASLKTTFKITPEQVRNLPNPPFSILIFGMNSVFLLGSPLLLFLNDYGRVDGFAALFGLAFFLIPVGLCYAFATHKSWSKWLIVIQAGIVAAWVPETLYSVPFIFIALYIFIGRVPRTYYEVLKTDQLSDTDLALLSRWPKNTMSVLDWFSEAMFWLFALAAVFLFAGLFIPGIIFTEATL